MNGGGRGGIMGKGLMWFDGSLPVFDEVINSQSFMNCFSPELTSVNSSNMRERRERERERERERA